MSDAVEPLSSLLHSLVTRLSAVEAQLGMAPVAPTAGGALAAPAKKVVKEDPRLIRAYDEYTR